MKNCQKGFYPIIEIELNKEEQYVKLLKDICVQLSQIHQKGAVHADIHKENIYLQITDEEEKYILIAPKGLKRNGEKEVPLSDAYQWKDSVYAPEYRRNCFKGIPVIYNPGLDLYSMMIVFYQLLTSQKLSLNFRNNKMWKTVMEQYMVEWKEETKRAVLGIFFQCTRTNSSQRWRNVMDLMDSELYQALKS